MSPDFFKIALKDCNVSLLGLDPGETTGFAHFVGSQLMTCGQIVGTTVPGAYRQIRQAIQNIQPNLVVMEDYKVYSWKTKDHAWQSLFTPRLIGAIECLCDTDEVLLVKRMAQEAKNFCTDDKLRTWGLWKEGQRHARDAIRHAVYHMLFHVAKIQVREKP